MFRSCLLALLIIILSLAGSRASLAEDCRLTYGIYNDYKPFEWMENGEPHGINVELFKTVAREAGCDFGIVSLPWPVMIGMLERNELNVLSASITPSRLEHFLQLPPDFVQYRVLVGRKGSPFVNDIVTLQGKVVLVLESSVAHESLAKTNPEVTLKLFNSERSALRALSTGEGDFALIDDTSDVSGQGMFSNLTVLSQPMFPTLYGFMLRKDSPYFSRLNEAAERLKYTGEYYAVIKDAKNYRVTFLLRAATIGMGVLGLLLLLIFLWNKSLQVKVRQKTTGLNEAIAKHVETEKELRVKTTENETLLSLLQTILNSLPVLVYIVDRKGGILWHNKKDDQSFDMLVIREDLSDLPENFGSEEFSAQDEEDNLWKILALEFQYMGEPAILLFINDITENVRLRDELFMTSRYSALGEMAALVAHEINNPVGSILHNFDFIWNHTAKTGDAELVLDMQDARQAVMTALGRIEAIIEDLRGYGLRPKKEYEIVDLRECIKSAVGITRFLINKCTADFTMDLADASLTYGNYGQIEQMIINVLQNSCYALTDKSQSIHCSLHGDDDYIRLVLSDEGAGMDESVLRNACKPYFSTRKDSGGTGLGLSLTSRLIKEHGGYMEIRSLPGQGTRVALYFPWLHGEEHGLHSAG